MSLIKRNKLANADVSPKIPPPPGQNKARNLKLPLVAGLVGLMLLMISAVVYVTYVLPSRPEAVLGRSLINLIKLETYDQPSTVDIRLVATDDSLGSMQTEISLKMTTDSDDNRSYQITLKLVDGAQDKTYSMNLESVVVDGKIYARINGLEGLIGQLDISQAQEVIGLLSGEDDQANSLLSILEAADGVWFDITQLEEPFMAGLESGLRVDVPTQLLSTSDIEDIINESSDLDVLSLVKDHGRQEVGGIETNHYEVYVNSEDAATLVNKILRRVDVDKNVLSSWQIAEVVDQIKKADWQTYPFNVWVDRSNDSFVKMTTSNQYPSGLNLDFEISITPNQSAINIPNGSQTLEEFFADYLTELEGLTQQVLGATLMQPNLLDQSSWLQESESYDSFNADIPSRTDSQIIDEVNLLQSKLEDFYIENGYYPDYAQVYNEDVWGISDSFDVSYFPSACDQGRCQTYIIYGYLNGYETYTRSSFN